MCCVAVETCRQPLPLTIDRHYRIPPRQSTTPSPRRRFRGCTSPCSSTDRDRLARSTGNKPTIRRYVRSIRSAREGEGTFGYIRYLVVHSKSYNLREEGPGESRAHQLTIRAPKRRLVQTLAHDTPGEFVVFQFQMRRSLAVRMHQRLLRLPERREQTVSGVEQGGADQFEPFASHATPIDACRDTIM